MSTDTSPAAVEAMCKMLLDKGPNGGHFVQFGPEAAAMLRAVASERDEGAERYNALNTLMNGRSAALGEMQDRAIAAEAEARALREALGEICRDSNPDWTEKRVYPNDVLDDIHSLAVNAYYKVTL